MPDGAPYQGVDDKPVHGNGRMKRLPGTDGVFARNKDLDGQEEQEHDSHETAAEHSDQKLRDEEIQPPNPEDRSNKSGERADEGQDLSNAGTRGKSREIEQPRGVVQ